MAARWVLLLSRAVAAASGSHAKLEGLLIAVRCGAGPRTRFLELLECCSDSMWGVFRKPPSQGSVRWLMALFLQYIQERPSYRSMVGSHTLATAPGLDWFGEE